MKYLDKVDIFKRIYLPARFYLILSIISVLFIFGFFFEVCYLIAKISLLAYLVVVAIDFYLLFSKLFGKILLTRELPNRLSNGDINTISIDVNNQKTFPVDLLIKEEVPFQFQLRDISFAVHLDQSQEKSIDYQLTPTERGEYNFGSTNLLVRSKLGLAGKREKFGAKETIIPVYPSFLKMHQYEILAISNKLTQVGIKRIRKIGAQSEFDHIRDYVNGDNYKKINWKASAKSSKLKINSYQDERAQNVYNIIDMGRNMKMSFDGLSLLDYAINASLIISDTALRKHDKAGLITYNTKINTFFQAERKNDTLTKILEHLYKQDTFYQESNLMLLAAQIKKKITHRSLIIYYTNYETLESMKRHLNYLKVISKYHLLLVVIFKNEEVEQMSFQTAEKTSDIYNKVIAGKFIYDKKIIVKELQRNGIYSILTNPENLNTNLINKYLELKDRGRL